MDLAPGWVDRIDWKNGPALERRSKHNPYLRSLDARTPEEREAEIVHRLAVQAEEDAAFKFYDPHALTD